MIGAVADLFAPPASERAIELYDWQAEAVEQLRANIREGAINQILASPTGSGKTEIAAYLLHECHQKGRRGVFVADRINLIDKTSQVFAGYGIPHGVIQGTHWRHQPWQRIQVASAQTLATRGWPDADLIIVDEAHGIQQTVMDRIIPRRTVCIGLTATPFTKGLGKVYKRVVTVRTTNQLISDGYLAPFDIWAASEPDMTDAGVEAGEWTKKDAAERAMPIIGDVVAEYLKHGAGKKFIAFGVNVRHTEEMQRQMMAAGIVCGLYNYRTPDADRVDVLRDFATPGSYLQGLISVAALAKGFDSPGVEVIIMARPLRSSLAEHIQILGRGLRRDPANPEKRCIVLDHSGNCQRFFGPMMDFFEHGAPPLDMGIRKDKAAQEPEPKLPYKCPDCKHLHMPMPTCPKCGYEYPRRNRVEHVPGVLSKLTGLPEGSRDDRQAVYSQLLGVAHQYRYMVGWARHRYRERFGVWPNGLVERPEPPTRELARWSRTRTVASTREKVSTHA